MMSGEQTEYPSLELEVRGEEEKENQPYHHQEHARFQIKSKSQKEIPMFMVTVNFLSKT